MGNRNQTWFLRRGFEWVQRWFETSLDLIDLAIKNPKSYLLLVLWLNLFSSSSCSKITAWVNQLKENQEMARIKNLSHADQVIELLKIDRKEEMKEEDTINNTIDDARNLLEQLKSYEYNRTNQSSFYWLFDENIKKLDALLKQLDDLNSQEDQALENDDFDPAMRVDDKWDELRDETLKLSIELRNSFLMYIKSEKSWDIHNADDDSEW